mgnify:CR=1 FL=1
MKHLLTVITAAVILLTCNAGSALAAQIPFTLHRADESITAIVRKEGGQAVLKETWYNTSFYLDTSTSVNQLAIQPVNPAAYEQALNEVKFASNRLKQYHVYILPYMLKNYAGVQALTFKTNTTVVFANTWLLTDKATHKLAAHELGHQVDFQLMTPERWAKYRKIRGIENYKYDNASKEHKDRPQEIFAEDFRILFGGSLAAEKPHENSELKDPREIPDLKAFFEELAA